MVGMRSLAKPSVVARSGSSAVRMMPTGVPVASRTTGGAAEAGGGDGRVRACAPGEKVPRRVGHGRGNRAVRREHDDAIARVDGDGAGIAERGAGRLRAGGQAEGLDVEAAPDDGAEVHVLALLEVRGVERDGGLALERVLGGDGEQAGVGLDDEAGPGQVVVGGDDIGGGVAERSGDGLGRFAPFDLGRPFGLGRSPRPWP